MATSPNRERARRRDQAPPPSARQLAYLRALASRTGTTFAAPRHTRDASLEIARLQKLPQKYRK